MQDKNREEKLTPQEELQAENQIKALNHELAYKRKALGDKPKESLEQFQLRMDAYQTAYGCHSTMVKIYDHIGKPKLIPDTETSMEVYEKGIGEIMNVLTRHGIYINRPVHLSAKGYYNFLKTDLLTREIMDIPLPDIHRNFLYSDFREDEPHFIKEIAEEFLQEMLDLNLKFDGDFLSETCRDQNIEISKAEAIKRIHDFRSRYREIVINGLSADRTQMTDKGMFFFFGLVWQGFPIGDEKPEIHKGVGVCQMELHGHCWWVKGVVMPGFHL